VWSCSGRHRSGAPVRAASSAGAQSFLTACASAIPAGARVLHDLAVSCRRFRGLLAGGWLAVLACVCVVGAEAAGGIDLHRFDWNRALLPGSICGVGHPIRLHSGYATANSHRWPALSPIEAARGSVVYGDLLGGGAEAAALQIVCINLGGTAAGQLAFAVVVYAGGQRGPTVLGVLTPRLRSSGKHVPILTPAAITRDKVLLTELYYGRHDADCCPTGQAATVWRFKAGTFQPVSTVVQRAPDP
jgi:hypothetical protein